MGGGGWVSLPRLQSREQYDRGLHLHFRTLPAALNRSGIGQILGHTNQLCHAPTNRHRQFLPPPQKKESVGNNMAISYVNRGNYEFLFRKRIKRKSMVVLAHITCLLEKSAHQPPVTQFEVRGALSTIFFFLSLGMEKNLLLDRSTVTIVFVVYSFSDIPVDEHVGTGYTEEAIACSS